jgi:hypothetical protein
MFEPRISDQLTLMSVVNSRTTNSPPWPQALLPIECTGPAMRLQTTVDQTLIRGLVTRIDRYSSGASQRLVAGVDKATEVTRWGSPPLASPPALCT